MKKTYISPSMKRLKANGEALMRVISVPITNDTNLYPEAANEGHMDNEEDDYMNIHINLW